MSSKRVTRALGLASGGFASATLLTAAAGLALSVSAHEEDWRKLADRTGVPVDAAPITGGRAPRGVDFDSSGVQLLSWLPNTALPGNNAESEDSWGYVSPSGREYAIVTMSSGTSFVEVTDPFNPVIVGYVAGATSLWHDVKIIEEYAYIVSEGGLGIQVVDMTDIDGGNVTLIRNKTQSGHTTTHNIVSNTDSGYLYLCGANIANGGLIAVATAPTAGAVDASLTNPVIVGAWTDSYVHDAQVVTMTAGPYAGREIAFCYTGPDGLEILDVTDKGNMFKLGGTSYPGLRYSHQGWLSDDRQYVFLNDELDEGASVSVTTTRIFRVYDPDNAGPGAPSLENPVFVGTFTSGSTAIDHNLYVRDNVIYQANYRSGLRVFDALDPTNPVQVAYFDTFPANDNAQFNGAWNNYPFLPSGNIIVSDIERGLFMLRVDPTVLERLAFDTASALSGPGVSNAQAAWLAPGSSVTFTAGIDAIRSEIDPATVRLRVSRNGAPSEEIAMTPVGDDWAATVSTGDCFDTLTLEVVASTSRGVEFASDAITASVVTSSEVTLDDNAETDIGWTVSGDATAGVWERGVPVDGGRADPITDADGSGSAWLTGNNLGPNFDGNSDVDGGRTELTSPALSAPDGSVLSYRYWFNDVASGAAGPEDFFRVEVSTDNGDSFTIARTYDTTSPEWLEDSISFGTGGEFPATDELIVRFAAADLSPGDVIECGVDAIRIQRLLCDGSDPCASADLTTGNTNPGDFGFAQPDGVVDTADLTFFVERWVGSDSSTDLTTDGSNPGDDDYGVPDGNVSVSDLVFLVELWLGC
ncbi:MAG: choice-of-anchor B family protein [Planctomycetota bacterium]